MSIKSARANGRKEAGVTTAKCVVYPSSLAFQRATLPPIFHLRRGLRKVQGGQVREPFALRFRQKHDFCRFSQRKRQQESQDHTASSPERLVIMCLSRNQPKSTTCGVWRSIAKNLAYTFDMLFLTVLTSRRILRVLQWLQHRKCARKTSQARRKELN